MLDFTGLRALRSRSLRHGQRAVAVIAGIAIAFQPRVAFPISRSSQVSDDVILVSQHPTLEPAQVGNASEADTLFEEGERLFQEGSDDSLFQEDSYKEALDYYNQALLLFRAEENRLFRI